MSSINITVLPSGTSIIEVDGVVSTFASEADAVTAVAILENGAEFTAQATAYCDYKGISGKNAVGKVNVITDFLAYVASGSPEAAPVVEGEAAPEAVEAADDEAPVAF